MKHPETDEIAREAARMLRTGAAAGVTEAIQRAAQALRLDGVRLPGTGLVRRHAQAMAMQELGEPGYARSVKKVLSIAEQVMTAIEPMPGEPRTELAGRAAAGQIDGDVALHIRVYTSRAIEDIASELRVAGYDDAAFSTLESRHGRLSQATIMENDVRIVLTRCPRGVVREPTRDLVTGKRVVIAELDAVRRMVAG